MNPNDEITYWRDAYMWQCEVLDYIHMQLMLQGLPGSTADLPERMDSLIRMLDLYRERAYRTETEDSQQEAA